MIWPTLVSVRKNSSSSSIAISGAGWLAFITPTSMIARGSTWPVNRLAGVDSGSGTSPIAPLNVKVDRACRPATRRSGPDRRLLHEFSRHLCARLGGIDIREARQRPEAEQVGLGAVAIVAKPSPPEICWHLMAGSPSRASGSRGRRSAPRWSWSNRSRLARSLDAHRCQPDTARGSSAPERPMRTAERPLRQQANEAVNVQHVGSSIKSSAAHVGLGLPRSVHAGQLGEQLVGPWRSRRCATHSAPGAVRTSVTGAWFICPPR